MRLSDPRHDEHAPGAAFVPQANGRRPRTTRARRAPQRRAQGAHGTAEALSTTPETVEAPEPTAEIPRSTEDAADDGSVVGE